MINFETIMVTVPRPENYIAKAVSSLMETAKEFYTPDKPLRLSSGCVSRDYLNEYQAFPNISISRLSEEEAIKWNYAELNLGSKCALGHYKAMRIALELQNSLDLVLICEDDIKFSKAWRYYLDNILTEIKRKYSSEWVLTLYRFLPGMKPHYDENKKWFETSKGHFYGTQAIVYPKCVLEKISQYLYQNCVNARNHAIDDGIGVICEKKSIPLLVTVPSIVQHIGEKTTGLSGYFHQAEYFVDDLTAKL